MVDERKKVSEVMKEFESPALKSLNLHDVQTALNRILPEDRSQIPPEWHYEKVAADFIPDLSGKNELGSGDFFKDKIPELSAKAFLKADFLNYWQQKAFLPISPFLSLQYCALVIDLSQKILKCKPSFGVVQKFLELVLEISQGEYQQQSTYNLRWLKIGFQLAIRYSQTEKAEQILNTVLQYEISNGPDKYPGLWGHAMDLVNKYPSKISAAITEKVITEMQNRFSRIGNHLGNDGIDLNCLRRSFELLSNYYKRTDKLALRKLFDDYSIIVQEQAATLPVFNQLKEIEDLHRLAKVFHFTVAAKLLSLKVRELSPQTLPFFTSIFSDQPVNKEAIETVYDYFSKGAKEELINKLIVLFTPQIARIRAKMKEDQGKYFFKQFLGTQIIGKKGIKSAVIEPLNQENEEKHLIKEISDHLIFSSFNLRTALQGAINEGGLSHEDVIDYWQKSWFFNNEISEIVRQAILTYFDQNLIVFMPVITPVIEGFIRNIIEAEGGNVLKIDESDGSQELVTLGSLLRMPEAKKIFGEENTLYLRTLLTEKLGHNIRNELSHGNYLDSDFNKQNADRLFHIFLLLCSFRAISE